MSVIRFPFQRSTLLHLAFFGILMVVGPGVTTSDPEKVSTSHLQPAGVGLFDFHFHGFPSA